MNRIHFALPLLLVGAGLAERVPVLSSPRALVGTSAPRAQSFNAWGDTLVAARQGFLHRIVRSGDQVQAIDSIVSPSIDSYMPLVLRSVAGKNLVVGAKSLLSVNWIPGTPSVTTAVTGLTFGSSRAQGGFTTSEASPEELVLCSESRSFKLLQPPGQTWRLVDSVKLADTLQTLCDVDPSTSHAVRMVRSFRASGAQVAYGFATSILGASTTATPHRPTSILTAYEGAWLGFNADNGSVYLGGRGQGTVTTGPVDIDIPVLDQNVDMNPPNQSAPVVTKNVDLDVPNLPGYWDSLQLDILKTRLQIFVPPVRKDSLVVFAVDSNLVLAKWTLNRFQVLNTVRLDGRVNFGLALADSTLWVNVDGTVLSFRVSWKEDQTIGTQSRQARTRLNLVQEGRQVRWTWMGSTEGAFSIHGLNGQKLASLTVLPGKQASWTAPKPGLYLVKTPGGTHRIMVK